MGSTLNSNEDMIVLVEGDKIFDVAHRGQITTPNDYYVIDAEGRTMMPGIIDRHVHLEKNSDSSLISIRPMAPIQKNAWILPLKWVQQSGYNI